MLRGLAKETPRMRLDVTESQRIELEAAAAAEKGVRRWRRYQAVLLLAAGHAPAVVAQTLRCSRASVYLGRRAGGRPGWRGCAKATTAGVESSWARAARRCWRDCWPAIRRPTATSRRGGRCRCCARNWLGAGRRSGRGPSAALKRLGYRWKRPRYVLGRPDPDYEAQKGS